MFKYHPLMFYFGSLLKPPLGQRVLCKKNLNAWQIIPAHGLMIWNKRAIFAIKTNDMEQNINGQKQLQIELKEDVAQGVYSNLAMITHSSSEFVMDFISILPGMAKAQVKSRVVMSPEHAKRLLMALQENVSKYENSFGEIEFKGPKGSYMPPIADFHGEA